VRKPWCHYGSAELYSPILEPTMTAVPPAQSPYSSSAAGPRLNTLAIVALVLGIVIPPGGIICGHIALNQNKRTGEAGRGLALAGTIIGYVFTVLWVLGVILFALLVGLAASNGTLYQQ
jgi:hypothetical protein